MDNLCHQIPKLKAETITPRHWLNGFDAEGCFQKNRQQCVKRNHGMPEVFTRDVNERMLRMKYPAESPKSMAASRIRNACEQREPSMSYTWEPCQEVACILPVVGA